MSLLLAVLLQVGPFGTTPPPAPPQRSAGSRPPAGSSASALPQRARSRLESCMSAATDNPVDAIDDAEAWRDETQGPGQAEALQCLGAAHARLERWTEAEQAFLAGREAASRDNALMRARLGAMAGNSALAQGAFEQALTALDHARSDASATDEPTLKGEIAIDRARALVELKREEDAATALAEARGAVADNALAWLLSATLSRRMGKLDEAQAQIATAAELAPRDPEIGLEAGVIAMLAGNEGAARKSWQSAIDTAPSSEAARSARSYLAQLGTPAQSKP